MGRPPKGHVRRNHGALEATFSILGDAKSFRLTNAASDEEGKQIGEVMLDALLRLRGAGKESEAEAFLGLLARSDDRRKAKILKILDGVIRGTEQLAPAPERPVRPTEPTAPTNPVKMVTFGEFAERS